MTQYGEIYHKKNKEAPRRVLLAAYGSVPEQRHLLAKAHHTAYAYNYYSKYVKICQFYSKVPLKLFRGNSSFLTTLGSIIFRKCIFEFLYA